MNRNYKLYVHINKINGKRYYGITGQKISRRWRNNGNGYKPRKNKNGKGYKGNKHFWNAINKYGWDNFEHIVLFEGLTEEEAKLMEKCYVALYDTTNQDKGYNMTNGGEGVNGYKHTEEWKQENSKRMKGRYKGEKHPQFGTHHTEEWKQEHSKKMSGKNNPRATSVICLTTKRMFLTAKEGAEYYNIGGSGEICNCCKGFRTKKDKKIKVKSAGKLSDGTKLVWRYLIVNHNKILRGKDISKLHKINEKVA